MSKEKHYNTLAEKILELCGGNPIFLPIRIA